MKIKDFQASKRLRSVGGSRARLNKKGESSSVATVVGIIILLVLLVLVILQWVFGITIVDLHVTQRSETNSDKVRADCNVLCAAGSQVSFGYCCEKREVVFDKNSEMQLETCNSDSRLDVCRGIVCTEATCEDVVCGVDIPGIAISYFINKDGKYYGVKTAIVNKDSCDGKITGTSLDKFISEKRYMRGMEIIDKEEVCCVVEGQEIVVLPTQTLGDAMSDKYRLDYAKIRPL